MPKTTNSDKEKEEEEKRINLLIQQAVDNAMLTQSKQFTAEVSRLQAELTAAKLQAAAQSGTSDVKPKTTVKTEDSDSDNEIELLIKRPVFTNKDTSIKMDQERLARVKNKKLNQIPHLRNIESNTSTNVEEIQTNYEAWKIALLNYYQIVHPSFHKWIIQVASALDLDVVQNDPDLQYPKIPDSLNMSTLDKIELKEATTATIKDYAHLVDGLEPTDVVKAFFNVYVYFQPNSVDTRADKLEAIWTCKLQDDTPLSKFVVNIQRLAREINLQHGSTIITEDSMMSIVRKALKQSSRYPAYKQALVQSRTIRCKTVIQLANFLHNNRDKQAMPPLPPTTAQANAVRTTNNHYYDRQTGTFVPRRGGRGGPYRGRGGKGGKGRGGSQNSSSSGPPSNNPNSNPANGNPHKPTSYIKATDQNGSPVIGKVRDYTRTSSHCIQKILYGTCTRPNCFYKHDFQVIDTSSSNNQGSGNNQQEDQRANADLPDQEGNSTSLEDQQQQDPVDSQGDQADQEHEFFNAYAHAQDFVNDIGPNLALNVTDEIIFDPIQVALLFCLLPFRFLLTSFSVLARTSVNILSSLSKKIFRISSSLVSTSAWLLLSLYFRCSHQRCAAADSSKTEARMPIILDSGATMAMSGDLSLFIRSSMVPIKSNIKLAQAGSKAHGTHIGKISINGKVIDCIYVPTFKQTLLSLGWFLNLGMTTTTSTKGDMLIHLPDNSPYLTFRLTSNNLFYLDTTNEQSA